MPDEIAKPQVYIGFSWRRVLTAVILLIGLLALIGLTLLYFLDSQSQNPYSNSYKVASKSATKNSSVTSLSDWKSYKGKNFSFKHPASWVEEPSLNNQNNLEELTLRLSPDAIFTVNYKKYSYSESIKEFKDYPKSYKLIVSDRESSYFELPGKGHPIPQGYSLISVVVAGAEKTSFLIGFNGDRDLFSDDLIKKILATFTFPKTN